jgi:hypothetical protein
MGLNTSQVKTVEPLPEESYIFGFSFTVFSSQYITKAFYIQPELSFSQKGYYFQDGPFYTRHRFSYLELPVLFKAVLDKGMFMWFIGAGPQVAYAMSGWENTTSDNNESFGQIIFDEHRNRADYGFVAAIGTDISIGPGFINTDIRIDYSFRPINDASYKPRFFVFGVSLGYSLYTGFRGRRLR